MYESYWGLSDTPFRARVDRRFFFESPTHEEALARLHFLVDQRRRLGLLLGAQGSGKSVLLDVFADEIRASGRPVAKLGLTGVGADEFLRLVAAGLQISVDRGLSHHALWQTLADRLAEFRYQELETVVLLDDADAAEDEVAAQICRLAQLESLPESRLTIVLSGREERIGRLGSTLLELAELRVDLEPWEPNDTADFVHTLLSRAGRDDPLFADPAVLRLHELGGGVPRRISQIADLALLAGAGRNLDRIDADTVESAFEELGVIEV